MPELKEFLHSISPLSTASWNAVRALFKAADLNAGDFFTQEGEFCKEFAFLNEGVVRAYCRSENGKEYNKHFFLSGSIIGGYTSLITNTPNQFIQQALTPCRIQIANYNAMVSLYDKHHDLERIGRLFAERYFVEKEQKEVEIILHDAEQRYSTFQNQYPDLEQLIPQYHIASYLGVTPTQLSRIRRKRMGK